MLATTIIDSTDFIDYFRGVAGFTDSTDSPDKFCEATGFTDP